MPKFGRKVPHKGLACPSLEGRFPTFYETRIPVPRSKVKVILGTLMPRHTNFKLGIRMEDDDPHQPQAP